MAAQLCESGNTAHGSDYTSRHFGQANHGSGTGNHHIAVEDGFCTAAHTDPIHCCDDRLGAPTRAHTSKAATLEPLDGLVDLGIGLHGLARRMSHCLGRLILAQPVFEILSGAECSTLASEDDDPQRRLCLEPVKDAADVLFHGIGHCVELFGPVEGHLEHMASRRGKDQVRAHLRHDQL